MTMSGKDFETACQDLVGSDAHGWKKAAAAALGVSRQTLDTAIKSGPTDAVEGMLILARAHVKEVSDDDALIGSWMVGETADRKRDSLSVLEVIVTHIAAPAFALHAELRRGSERSGVEGVDAHDTAVIEYKIRWIGDKPAKAQAARYIEKAKRLAGARIDAARAARAQGVIRADIEARARTACGMSASDAAVASELGIVTARHMSDVRGIAEAMRELGRRRAALEDLHRGTDVSEAVRRAYRDGVAAGKIAMQEAFLIKAELFGERAQITELVAHSRPLLDMLLDTTDRLAHKETTRGLDFDAERDFAEMSEMGWGDEAEDGAEDVELHELDIAMLERYSRGEMTERQACEKCGYRDGAELLLALAEASLPFPRPPRDVSEAQAEIFAGIMREAHQEAEKDFHK